MDAQAFLKDPRFNCVLELPNFAGCDKFHVKYADYGYRGESRDNEAVLLFLGPLFSTRMIHIFKDEVAKKRKVRIICIDRPGFGGTDAVEVPKRIELTRAIHIALLHHLHIRHVALASQSAGTVYALDLALHHPEILDPKSPYLALGVPWIHSSHTGNLLLGMGSMLPVSAIGSLDKVVSGFQVLQRNASPVLKPITGVSQIVSGAGASTGAGAGDAQDEDSKREEELFPQVIQYAHAESIKGLSDEAVVAAQRIDGTKGWGDWTDYDTLLPRLASALQAPGRKLSVDIFFAEKDMITGNAGTKGPVWFEECFKQAGIAHESHVLMGADHDSAWNLRFGVPKKVFNQIGESRP